MITDNGSSGEGMDFLGLSLDAERNETNGPEISDGPVRALVIPTDEERIIARAVAAHLSENRTET